MDNPAKSWGTSPVVLWTTGGLAVVFAVAAVSFGTSGDGAGALLVGLVAVLTGLGTAAGVVIRPRLTADGAGIEIRTLTRRRRAPWNDVETAVVTTRRLGRDVRTLEIEIGDDLVVLGWLELGAHPEDVHDVLERLRPAA